MSQPPASKRARTSSSPRSPRASQHLGTSPTSSSKLPLPPSSPPIQTHRVTRHARTPSLPSISPYERPPSSGNRSHFQSASISHLPPLPSPLQQQSTLAGSGGSAAGPSVLNFSGIPSDRSGGPGTTLPSFQAATGWASTSAPYVAPAPSPLAGSSEQGVFSRRESVGLASEMGSTSADSVMGGRDLGRERPPRSMMACVRCRKQKMKCDGPAAAPCRGCRGANVTCVFETRTRSSRPKSISTMTPSQPLPAMLSTGTPGHFGPSPPSMSHQSGRSLDPYSLAGMTSDNPTQTPTPRRTRDAMPPPAAVFSNLGPAPSPSSQQPPMMGVPYIQHMTTPRGQVTAQLPASSMHRSSASHSRHPSGGGHMSPLPQRTITPGSGQMMDTENRIRHLEAAIQSLQPLQASHSALQATVAYLESQARQLINQVNALSASLAAYGRSPIPGDAQASLTANLAGRGSIAGNVGPAPRMEATVVSDHARDGYRTYFSSLTPWLFTLSSSTGLSGEVIASLGARVYPDEVNSDIAKGFRARAEVGRLVSAGEAWSEDDVRALGVYATWEGNGSLASTAIGQARTMAHARWLTRSTLSSMRTWVEMVVMEHMLASIHCPELMPATVYPPISPVWRDRLRSNESITPSERDRDIKLLAWLEYAEIMADAVTALSQLTSPPLIATARPGTSTSGRLQPIKEDSSPESPTPARSRRAGFLARWEGWKAQWGGAGDPILALHYQYAVLFTTSPLVGVKPGIWQDLMHDAGGYEQLEKARDAGIDLIRSICSPEIARSLPYSLPLFRNLLAFAVAHLIAQITSIPHSPLTPLPLIQSILRLAYERLGGGQPSQWPAVLSPPLPGTLLAEVVEMGNAAQVGKRAILGQELRRDLWKKVVGGQ